MKKNSILLLSTLLLASMSVAGCGNGGTSGSASTKTSSATQTTSVAQIYTINFMNGEEVYKSYQLKEGEQIVPPETNPTKPSAGGYEYKFEGWSEDKEIINLDFPKAQENKTYYAMYGSKEITYTATIHFNYDDGPEDELITYTVKDNLTTKANEVKAYLPETTSEATYTWDSPIPSSLPLEDKTYTVNELKNFFSVDMSSEKVDQHFKFIKRSGEEFDSSMKMVNNAIEIKTSNDYFMITNKYTNFDLKFKMKISNNDRFNLVIGTNEENMKLAHATDNDEAAVDGVIGLTLVPSHASCVVRMNSAKGGEQHQKPLHIDTTKGFNVGDGIDVRVRMMGYKCEIFYNDYIVDAFTLTSEKYTFGNHIGFAFSGESTVTISQFSIADFTDTSFSHNMGKLERVTEQLLPIGDGASTSYNSTSQALEFPAAGHRKMTSFHQISSDFKLTVKIKYAGTSSDRVDLLFGLKDSDLNTTFSGGQNNSHSAHPGVMNALIVPNHPTSNVRLFYNGINENQFSTVADRVDMTTNFVTLEVSCYKGLFTFKINGQENNTYQLPDSDFPERGYFGICSGQGSGTISITEITLVDNYIAQ